MTPRTPLAGFSCCRSSLASASASHPVSSLVPLLVRLALSTTPPTTAIHHVQQARRASVLGSLRNNPGAVKNRTRVGRGPSSGHGKTSGRGHKGTLQRGKVNPWFQGGQTPLVISRGQKGEDSVRTPVMAEVNLDSIQAWIDQGRLDPTRQITPKELVECGLARVKDGVKILARNASSLTTPISVMASRASEAAIRAIEEAGGRIVTRYYTKDSIHRLLAGESINTDLPLAIGKQHVPDAIASMRGPDGMRLYRLPDPTSRFDIEYYRDPKHRGYLSPLLKEGETPSLFHKVPKPIDDEELKRLMQVKMEKLRAKGREKKQDKRLF